MTPIVVITTDRRDPGGLRPGPKVRPVRPEAWVSEAYVDAVRRAGGLPLLLPPGDADLERVLGVADAVLLTGGDFDIHPRWYGEAQEGRLDRIEEQRTALELALAALCLERDVPVLGICGGMQALAVAAGGRLVQDLGVVAQALPHEQPTDPATPWHPVRVEAPATRWLPPTLEANSTHHQAVRDAGQELVACGWSPDGVVEVIASPRHRFVLGLQWHPELLGDLVPYRALVAAVSG